MGSTTEAHDKPHVLCIPYPAQGHINPMLQVAKLLHHKGFHISFVYTDFNHNRLIKSKGQQALDGLSDFRFYSIPDGLAPSDPDATQDIATLCKYTPVTCLAPFSNLISKLNDSLDLGVPPLTCIVSDATMSFTLKAAEKFGIPEILLWTASTCGLIAYMQYHQLVERGYTPLKVFEETNKPHVLCIPFPAQGHITPMLKLAKLLHHKGFHISFVNTEFNHNRLIKSRGPDALHGLPDFRFYTIPDGLPPSNPDATQDIPTLCKYTPINCLPPLINLISKLNDSSVSGVPPVSCIVFDGVMTFTLKAAEHFSIPGVIFWTASACGLIAYMQYRELVERGYIPLKADVPRNWDMRFAISIN
uniref:Glycosyltransferase N-terminal domain-containing protein n=1 Tax=Daucus carota subsp. sativus TaxID=79200 RepID=A0A175YD83_DAUCS